MLRHPFWFTALACLCLAVARAPGQDFRDTFKKPETAPEFWAAMQYEIEVGNYNLAAGYLKNFLEKNPSDQELLDIEAKQGLTAFLQVAQQQAASRVQPIKEFYAVLSPEQQKIFDSQFHGRHHHFGRG